MRIIPAIDIINGNCVRLTQGDYATKKMYNENPLEVAKEFEQHGITYLHVVDLDGAKAKGIKNHKTLEQIATHTSLKIDFGGGIKTIEDAQLAFDCGASQITVGSLAVTQSEKVKEIIDQFGGEKIILGADVKDNKVAYQGWLKNSGIDVFDFIERYKNWGIDSVICTDISKDGMLEGCSTDLYSDILAKQKVNLIASGGVSNIEDLEILQQIGCEGCIVGKALYENRISLTELKQFILKNNGL